MLPQQFNAISLCVRLMYSVIQTVEICITFISSGTKQLTFLKL